jgi:hypothetical protein
MARGSGDDSLLNGLTADVRVNPRELQNGDELRIVAKIRNTGSKSVYVENSPHPYAVAHVKVYSEMGTELSSYLKVVYELAIPEKDDFTKLKPGDEISMQFTATLRQHRIPDIRAAGRPQVDGLFLDFGSSAILVPEEGRYELKFELDRSKYFAEWMKDMLSLQDVWYGRVVSKPAQIVISL